MPDHIDQANAQVRDALSEANIIRDIMKHLTAVAKAEGDDVVGWQAFAWLADQLASTLDAIDAGRSKLTGRA